MNNTEKTPKETATKVLKLIIYIATAVLSFITGQAI